MFAKLGRSDRGGLRLALTTKPTETASDPGSGTAALAREGNCNPPAVTIKTGKPAIAQLRRSAHPHFQ